MSAALRVVAGALASAFFAAADLPVHCLRHEIAGEWEFTLGPLSSQRSSCGHLRPDNQEKQPAISLASTQSTKRVTLGEPSVAKTDKDASGRWTMIYDEAFEVNVESFSFLSFSGFDIWYDGGQMKNQSKCGETQLGWYHTQDRKQWGCFYGKKVSAPAAPVSNFLGLDDTSQTVPEKSADYDAPLSFMQHKEVVDNLNSKNNGWTATVYDSMVGKSTRELNNYAGIKRSLPLSDQGDPNAGLPPSLLEVKQRFRRSHSAAKGDGPLDFATLTETGMSYDDVLAGAPKSSAQSTVNTSSFPESLDYRFVNGRNWLEPVIDQGDCGSCYVVSTMRMLSARNKVRAKDPSQLPFSISFPLYCAEYNQGCDGGYAFLTSKWSDDVGMIPATCARYTTKGSCKIDPACVKNSGAPLRAKNHRYVGGFYGGANEEDMMQELVHNGPLVVSLEPKNDLMYYNGGIYKSGADEHAEWERVDHAVLLVGYGEENGEKYWTLQNSWGPEWGEAGFFRMARGINDSGIESIAVAADVVEDDHPEVLNEFVQSL